MLKSFVRRTTIVRSTRAILATAAAVGVALAAAASANAATITETFTFPKVTNGGSAHDGGSAEGSIFAAFDPALGTLNSVTYDVSGTSTFFTGPDDGVNAFQYSFNFQGPSGAASQGHTPGAAVAIGNTSATASLTDTVTDPLIDAFFGPGSVMPSVDVSFQADADISTVFATESVTYNFTPATPAVPEPSTWAMMGLGFAALAFAGYRQTSRPAATAV
jgi:PEP-CTERM motif